MPHLPRADEYNIAVQNPGLCFSDNDLKQGQIQTNSLGLPLPYSGGFTTTYKLTNGNSNWAVRCFTREIDHLQKRYQAIDDFIEKHGSKYLVEARYLKYGIQVNGKWHPIIKMKWIEGDLLNVHVAKIINHGKEELEAFSQEFLQLAEKLEKDHLAHGDLQHGNLILKNDRLFLIDYDGVYLPEIKSLGTGEIGHPNYQHPKRAANSFDETIDRFSSIVIFFALKALALKPDLWKKYNNGENLLFRKDDFVDPKNSELLYSLSEIPELKQLTTRFASICLSDFNKIPALADFIHGRFSYDQKLEVNKPKESENKKVLGGLTAASSQTASGFQYKPANALGGQPTSQTAAASHAQPASIHHQQAQASKNIPSKLKPFLIIGGIVLGALIVWAASQQSNFSTSGTSSSSIGSTSNTEGVKSTDLNTNAVNPNGCADGSVKSDKSGTCVTRDQYCSENNGVNSHWDGNYCACKTGFIWNVKGDKCITRDQSCKDQFGKFSESNFIGGEYKCGCSAGYIFNSAGKQCISQDQSCKEQYGRFSKSTGENKCGCADGYAWNNTDINQATACTKSCNPFSECLLNGQCVSMPTNSHCANDGVNAWKCDDGYNESYGQCIKNDLDANGCGDSSCQKSFGAYSSFDHFDTTKSSCICGCQAGYDWNQTRTACVAGCGYNQCSFNGSCVNKPANSYCVANSYRAWQCNYGYNEIANSCLSSSDLTTLCKQKYGYGSYFNGTIDSGKYNCDCSYGYHWDTSGSSCISD